MGSACAPAMRRPATGRGLGAWIVRTQVRGGGTGAGAGFPGQGRGAWTAGRRACGDVACFASSPRPEKPRRKEQAANPAKTSGRFFRPFSRGVFEDSGGRQGTWEACRRRRRWLEGSVRSPRTLGSIKVGSTNSQARRVRERAGPEDDQVRCAQAHRRVSASPCRASRAGRSSRHHAHHLTSIPNVFAMKARMSARSSISLRSACRRRGRPASRCGSAWAWRRSGRLAAPRRMLEACGRDHAVVVVGGGDQDGRIRGAALEVVQRRVGLQRLELARRSSDEP